MEKNKAVGDKALLKAKILVADDERDIVEVVRLYLEQAGFLVITALDGLKALELEAQESPDLLILDIMLPGMSGLDIYKSLRREVPVIFLTARSTEYDKIIGFQLGADDYVTKPFSPKELVARVSAVLRRSRPALARTEISLPGVKVMPEDNQIECQGQLLTLPPKEMDLLVFMIRHAGQALTREQLLNNVWGYDYTGDDRAVDAAVKRLRRKLEQSGVDYIHTVWGKGYKFEVLS